MTWYYNNEPMEEIPEGYIGFVYLITNLIDGRKYYGKKLFYFSRAKMVNGKKKKVKAESDWQKYYGSSEHLNEDVKNLGAENFKREIIHLCKTKGTMSYLELREQMDNRVLESDEYYNGFVGGKIHKSHVKLD